MYTVIVEDKDQEKLLLKFLKENKLNYITGLINKENQNIFEARKSKKSQALSTLINRYLDKLKENRIENPHRIDVIAKSEKFVMLVFDKDGNRIDFRRNGELERLKRFLMMECSYWADEMRKYNLVDTTSTFYIDIDNTYDEPKKRGKSHLTVVV